MLDMVLDITKKDTLGRMALNWFRAQWCAKTCALALAPILSKLDGSRGGGGNGNAAQ